MDTLDLIFYIPMALMLAALVAQPFWLLWQVYKLDQIYKSNKESWFDIMAFDLDAPREQEIERCSKRRTKS